MTDAQPPLKPTSGVDCRCVCGSLVARLVEGGVELKCRRCKRTLVVPLSPEAREQDPNPSPNPSPDATPHRVSPAALRRAG